MDRRSWLWRCKSSEKSPGGESESWGSASSHSERYSDDQEGLRAFPEDSSNALDGEVYTAVRGLNEKLSAALVDISAKEDLVKQHAKVSKEADAGWEQAETEVTALKQQLETQVQKNSSLESKINQLDGALEDCVRQLRRSKESREKKVHDSISASKMHKTDTRLVDVKVLQFGAAALDDHGTEERLLEEESLENENAALEIELRSRSEDLHFLPIERELSTKAADTASKLHLENIKKITKLEAECLRLRSINRRLLSADIHRPTASSVYDEFLTQSESGEHFLSINSCSDSWIPLLSDTDHQFNSKKESWRNLTTSAEIEYMDDFLEMERLVALPEADDRSIEQKSNSDRVIGTGDLPEFKNEAADHKSVERLEREMMELEIALAESCDQLSESCNQLTAAENKIIEPQRIVDMSDELTTAELMDLEQKCKDLGRKLESASLENASLTKNISFLEENCEVERQLSLELKAAIEKTEAARQALDSQLKSAHLEISSLNERVVVLERQGRASSSSELTAKVEALEAARMVLETQLEHARSEHSKQQEVVSLWEQKAREEMILSAEFAIKLEAAEVARSKLELDLESLRKFTAEVEATEASKKSLEVQLDSAYIQVKNLTDKVALLEQQIDEEKALSAELVTKCHRMEGDLSRINREADLWIVANLNRELKIKQEKELAVAAGKLEECQKTIASLNRQLKSLATFDDLMLESKMLRHNNLGMLEGKGSTGEAKGFHCNDTSEAVCNAASVREWNFPRTSSVSLISSPSSNMSRFTRTVSRTRSTAC